LWSQIIALTECHPDDPGATTELSGSRLWASSKFQVDGKDRALEPFRVVESPKQKITPNSEAHSCGTGKFEACKSF